MSFDPEFYNQRVNLFIAIGAVFTMSSLSSKILKFMTLTKVERFIHLMGKNLKILTD